MIVIPAVDVRGGRAVRLREGRPETETVFGDDPVAQATRWVGLGAQRLHAVDLDGAFGAGRQAEVIGTLIAAVSPVPVEVGGGLRDLAAVEAVLAAGARWAVIGTRAVLDPGFLAEVCHRHPERIIVAVDARGARVVVKGWTELSAEAVVDVGKRARDAGATALLYTDVSRDGTEAGPNVEATAALAEAVGMDILASGGVATLEHLRQLAAVPGILGTIVGRALYTGALDLRDAIEALGSSAGSARATDSRGEVRKGGGAPLRGKC